ncbi:MAG: DAK2 domain-containing protein, partial [Spirochaetales bacterium]|nr:DAK2 domain-containing protein [Spirochaetales bacterium]
MGETFKNSEARIIVENLVTCIKKNVDYLSEVDGKIADGDHGINMQKGFTITGQRIEGKSMGFSEAMNVLGDVLISEIGGSMGPIYGSYFMEIGDGCAAGEDVTKADYLAGYENALEVV